MVQALPEEVPDPGFSGSIKITEKPFFCSHSAQLQPTTPAPTTAMDKSLFIAQYFLQDSRIIHDCTEAGPVFSRLDKPEKKVYASIENYYAL